MKKTVNSPNVLRGTFPVLKSICQRCMAKTRVPLGTIGDVNKNGTFRKPVSWTDLDEDRWKAGLVLCPQMGHEAKPNKHWCLRAIEVMAVKEGAISVWDDSNKI